MQLRRQQRARSAIGFGAGDQVCRIDPFIDHLREPGREVLEQPDCITRSAVNLQ